MAGHAGDLLMRIGLRKDGLLRLMAVAAVFLHFRGRHGRHPVGAAYALLIVAGHAGEPFFIVLREGVLLGFFVEDLGEFIAAIEEEIQNKVNRKVEVTE